MTLREFVERYGSIDIAAGLLALGAERVSGEQWAEWPEWFHSRVLYQQNLSLIAFAAQQAGTTVDDLQINYIQRARQELKELPRG